MMGEFIWLYGEYDFYSDSLFPIVTREHFMKLVHSEQIVRMEQTRLPSTSF